MAAKKEIAVEREYIVNLRREIAKVPRHKRTPKAVKALKEFVARHMRIPERKISKVKLDKYLNQEMWFRGIKKPPAKIKIMVKKEKENIIVKLVDVPEKLKFQMQKEEKQKAEAEKEKREKETEKEKQKAEAEKEKTEQEQKDIQEKETASKEAELKHAENQAKESKHLSKVKETKINRMALQK